MKYQVITYLYEAGKSYKPGDEIELTDKRAVQMAHVLMDPPKSVEAPQNKMMTKKKTK